MRASTYPGLQGSRKCLAEPCWIGSVAAFFSGMRYLRVASTDVDMVVSRVRAQVVVNKEEVGKREWDCKEESARELAFLCRSQRPCACAPASNSTHMASTFILTSFVHL
jgi:hypothetical protein